MLWSRSRRLKPKGLCSWAKKSIHNRYNYLIAKYKNIYDFERCRLSSWACNDDPKTYESDPGVMHAFFTQENHKEFRQYPEKGPPYHDQLREQLEGQPPGEPARSMEELRNVRRKERRSAVPYLTSKQKTKSRQQAGGPAQEAADIVFSLPRMSIEIQHMSGPFPMWGAGEFP